TVSPPSAVTGGSNVFSAWKATTSTPAIVRPTARSFRNAASDSTSGSSGMLPDYAASRHVPERQLVRHRLPEHRLGPVRVGVDLVQHLPDPHGQIGRAHV